MLCAPGPAAVALPEDLYRDIRRTARQTNLSIADTIRQSIKLGLPRVIEVLSSDLVRPMSHEERRRCYEGPNPEFDALEHHCASMVQPIVPEEE